MWRHCTGVVAELSSSLPTYQVTNLPKHIFRNLNWVEHSDYIPTTYQPTDLHSTYQPTNQSSNTKTYQNYPSIPTKDYDKY